jgi:hypothetical protein
LDHAPHVAV